ncbi:uncharacterized protein N7459_002353 [Penicillium hispanicum]|uniref:uncharacterized protein n=1 Tax=Penicillium hispanicum TaxID=1080232 RepID=UPI0025419054|nr:uncharacterized protein N7459_002353 [Penicillium hispanicum]KAJ5591984.1 hypothetical protein N7459_002353 [Penicillium hispanicum]
MYTLNERKAKRIPHYTGLTRDTGADYRRVLGTRTPPRSTSAGQGGAMRKGGRTPARMCFEQHGMIDQSGSADDASPSFGDEGPGTSVESAIAVSPPRAWSLARVETDYWDTPQGHEAYPGSTIAMPRERSPRFGDSGSELELGSVGTIDVAPTRAVCASRTAHSAMPCASLEAEASLHTLPTRLATSKPVGARRRRVVSGVAVAFDTR